MKPTVWTKAFIEIKVVLSAMVVALDMYMMHKVTEPEKNDDIIREIPGNQADELAPAAKPTMNRAMMIQYLRGCGSAPTEAYKANPITFRIPVTMHKSRTDFQRLATYPTSGEEISWPKGLAAITQPRNFLSALGSICIVTEISLNGGQFSCG
jgi:hypothetical protein